MKKTMLAVAIPAFVALAACGDAATEQDPPADAAVLDDDDDAPEPVADEAHDQAEPHDESVPHDH
jgi:hypothetical protein